MHELVITSVLSIKTLVWHQETCHWIQYTGFETSEYYNPPNIWMKHWHKNVDLCCMTFDAS